MKPVGKMEDEQKLSAGLHYENFKRFSRTSIEKGNMSSTRKEVLQLIKKAEEQGFIITKTGGGHWKWLSPTGSFFYSPHTPSDSRGISNIKRDMRVHGFIEIEKKGGRKIK
jgi:hypothetical protein